MENWSKAQAKFCLLLDKRCLHAFAIWSINAFYVLVTDYMDKQKS